MANSMHRHVPHRATFRFTRNPSGEIECEPIEPPEYVPCAAAFAYWPKTKARWDAKKEWALHLCKDCAIDIFLIARPEELMSTVPTTPTPNSGR